MLHNIKKTLQIDKNLLQLLMYYRLTWGKHGIKE